MLDKMISPDPNSVPIRILHVIGKMTRGGAETWLMHILRNIDREIFKIDFLVGTTEPGAYDDEIRSLGSRIICCTKPANLWQYGQKFQQILSEYGPYDIVHSHVHHYSGYILQLAARAGIPMRIAHSHVDSTALEANSGWLRRSYLRLMMRWINRYATVGLGCSDVANADLFGANWKNDPRWQSYYYGIDLAPFEQSIDPAIVRSELGIPEQAVVIGHVGRFEAQKNHTFLIDIFAEVLKREPRAYLLLIGEGPLRVKIEQQVVQHGLQHRTIFAGSRADVPRLMLGAMDIFLLPSLCEGLPLVGIETQSAGLPAILSEAITTEICIVKSLITQLSLSQSVAIWAEEILRSCNAPSIDRLEDNSTESV
jgi:glycosyltransferase involved in cell wall biosynthesis